MANAVSDLTVSDGWFRKILPTLPAAGYFTLSNGGPDAALLVQASSPACASLSLHRSTAGGMEAVESVNVPAGGEIRFAPGGYHLMCMEPRPDMAPGAQVTVTFQFADGRTISSRFAVRNATGGN